MCRIFIVPYLKFLINLFFTTPRHIKQLKPCEYVQNYTSPHKYTAELAHMVVVITAKGQSYVYYFIGLYQANILSYGILPKRKLSAAAFRR